MCFEVKIVVCEMDWDPAPSMSMVGRCKLSFAIV